MLIFFRTCIRGANTNSRCKRSLNLSLSFSLNLRMNFCSAISTMGNNPDTSSADPDQFILDEPDTMNSLFPVNSFSELITENQEFLEYTRILDLVKNLSLEFDLEKFKEVIGYINENSVTDVFLFKQFESLFIANLNLVDYVTKATCVLMLGDYVNKKKTSFQEDNWMRILKDFQVLVESGAMSFADYYNYAITFDRLFSKKKVHELGGKYSREFDSFISFGNSAIFNSGKVPLKKLDDIFLFSKLTHSGVLRVSQIADSIWLRINAIISAEANEMNIYELLIVTSLFVNLHEVSGKAQFLLKDSVFAVNIYLASLMQNFALLEQQEQENLVNYADSLFNYYTIFVFSKTEMDFALLQSLIAVYTQKLKSKNHDFMIFKEFRILQLLAKETKYRDEEFWSLVAGKTLEYINKDFLKILNDIFPKRLLKSSSMTEEDRTRFQEKCDMQLLLYVGMIVETFTSAEYVEIDFWCKVLEKVDHFANFKTRDVFVVLNFITLGCKKMYRKENFKEVWEMFLSLLDPKVQPVFRNKEVLDFLIKMNSYSKESRGEIKLEELNACLNHLFSNDACGVESIKIFASFFSLIEHRVKDDDKVIMVLSNALVDLVKIGESKKQSDFELKYFQAKLRPLISDKVGRFVKERLKSLIAECEMKDLEEKEVKGYFYLVRKMMNADFIDRLDVVRMKFALQKEGKLSEEKAKLFQMLSQNAD